MSSGKQVRAVALPTSASPETVKKQRLLKDVLEQQQEILLQEQQQNHNFKSNKKGNQKSGPANAGVYSSGNKSDEEELEKNRIKYVEEDDQVTVIDRIASIPPTSPTQLYLMYCVNLGCFHIPSPFETRILDKTLALQGRTFFQNRQWLDRKQFLPKSQELDYISNTTRYRYQDKE